MKDMKTSYNIFGHIKIQNNILKTLHGGTVKAKKEREEVNIEWMENTEGLTGTELLKM